MKPFRTRGLVRRATPFLVIVAVFAVQVGADLRPVLAFPLYLAAVLMAALYLGRLDSLARRRGRRARDPRPRPSRGATAGRHQRAPCSSRPCWSSSRWPCTRWWGGSAAPPPTPRARLAEAEAQEERFRITVEAAQVGLALIAPSGAWLQVNERLCVILGRSRAELLHMTLGDVTAEHDQATVGEALAMLGTGDILRWEAELHQVRADGGRVPVEIAIAAVGDHPSGELVMLLQETDVSARKRLEGLRDGLVAVRHTIVSANSWEQAAPQLLGGLCAHLDWDLAQYWAVDGDLQALAPAPRLASRRRGAG